MLRRTRSRDWRRREDVRLGVRKLIADLHTNRSSLTPLYPPIFLRKPPTDTRSGPSSMRRAMRHGARIWHQVRGLRPRRR